MSNEQYRDKILTELANHKDLDTYVDYLGFKHSVSKDSQILDDIRQVCLMWMAKLKPEALIEMYEKDGIGGVLKYAGLIAERQGFLKPSKNAVDFNPKHSTKYHILFASSFQNTNSQISTMETFDEERESKIVLFDGEIQENLQSTDLPESILLMALERSEQQLIEAVYYAPKKRRGKRSRYLKDEIQYIKNKLIQLKEIASTGNASKLTYQEQFQLVFTYQQWLDYNVIFDEELSVKEKCQFLKLSESGYYYRRDKLIDKISNINRIINNKIKIVCNE